MSKKIVFVVALVATLTMSLAGAGLAYAQEPTTPALGYGVGCGYGGWGMRGGWGWGWHGMSLIDALAELTELDPTDLCVELQEGKTLLEVADAHGVTAEDLVEAALAPRAEVLQQYVGDGSLTQEQAEQMLEYMREQMFERLEAGFSPNCWRFSDQPTPNAQFGGGRRGGGRGMSGRVW